ncbi:MAG TPA: Rv3235 family protein [Micromonosporaceae bacterium]|jgi:Family of unknown function (DUF6459)
MLAAHVRLRPAPPLEPPFDDEVDGFGAGRSIAEGQLALDWRRDPPAGDRGPGRRDPAGDGSGRRDPGRDGGPAALLAAPPEHRVAAKRFVAVGLEVLNGYRPAGQLRPFCAPADAGTVVELFVTRAAADRCAGPAARRSGTRLRLRLLRVCEPRSGVAEAAAVFDAGDRCWAMAFRLERRRGSWLCTAVAMP